ncbi:hypothetical protein FOBRF1_012662 [Fusarium oxysporum]
MSLDLSPAILSMYLRGALAVDEMRESVSEKMIKNKNEGIARRFNIDYHLRCLHRLSLGRTMHQPTAQSMIPRFQLPMLNSNPQT